MATAWNDDHLNWIVPARRAVVRKKLNYSEAADAWRDQLEHYKDALKRWYGASGAFTFDAAVSAVKGWIDRFFGTKAAPVDASRTGDNTVKIITEGFQPRLWKGPLRVANEEAKKAIDAAPTLDDKMTVTNADAVFRMGDVLEWPLYAFLVKCGKTDYAAAAFAPKGSFYLGTTVTGADPATAPLHDNLLAMRVQQVLALGRGAFCAAKKVYEAKHSMPVPEGTDDKLEVYARGLCYAAELRNPGAQADKSRWDFEDYYWGRWKKPGKKAWEDHNEACAPVLYTKWTSSFPNDQPLTPGWTCSPFTLFLSNYILGDVAGTAYHGGVQDTIHFKGTFPLKTHFEYVESTTIVKDTTVQGDIKKTTDAVDKLRDQVKAAIASLSGQTALDAAASLQADAKALVQKPIQAEKTDPSAVLAAANELVEHKKKTTPELDDAQKDLVKTFHRDWIAAINAFPAGAGKTIASNTTWETIGQKAPAFATKGWPDACPADGCAAKHDLAVVKKALASLAEGLKELKPLDKDKENLFGGRGWVFMDFKDQLRDINIVVLDGHEYAYVRFRAFDTIAAETDLPRAGTIAGYDPLTGAPFVDTGAAPDGQLYVMDASGMLHQWTGEVQAMTPRNWVCAPVTNNRLVARYFSTNDHKNLAVGEFAKIYYGGMYVRGEKPWKAMVRLKDEGDLGTRYLHSKAWADLAWKPIQLVEKSKDVPGRETHYAERAVPFPTLAEVASVYPSVADALKVAQEIADQAKEYADLKEKQEKDAKDKADKEKADRDAAIAAGLPPPETKPPDPPKALAGWEKEIKGRKPADLRTLATTIVGDGNAVTKPAATAPAAPAPSPTPAPAPGPTASPAPSPTPPPGPANRPGPP